MIGKYLKRMRIWLENWPGLTECYSFEYGVIFFPRKVIEAFYTLQVPWIITGVRRSPR